MVVQICVKALWALELVRCKMNASLENGDVFIFLGKDCRNLKILRHESNSYVLYSKKMNYERFLLLVFNIDTDSYEIS